MKKLKLFASAIIVAMTALFISCEPKEVIIPVSGIEVCHAQMEFNIGESDSLTVNVLPLNATNRAYTLTADKEGIIEITDNKMITAIAAGEVNVTATSAEGEFTAVCKVIVHETIIPVEGISFKADNPLALLQGDVKEFEVEVLPENASDKSYSLLITNEEVAELDAENLTIEALKEGKTSIVATTKDGGFTAELKVIVTDSVWHVTSIAIEPLAAPLAQGDSVEVVVKVLPEEAYDKSFVLTSSDSSVVDVNGKVIKAADCGKATITATSNDGAKTATLEVEILPTKATVAEFNAAAEDDTWYELTGIVTNITGLKYGNMYFEDATGETFIYGVKTTKDGKGGQFEAELGDKVTVGDELTIVTKRGSHQGYAQGKDAYYVKHTDNEYPYVAGTDKEYIGIPFEIEEDVDLNVAEYQIVIGNKIYDGVKFGDYSKKDDYNANYGKGKYTLTAEELGVTENVTAIELSFYAVSWYQKPTVLQVRHSPTGDRYNFETIMEVNPRTVPATKNTSAMGVFEFTEEDRYTVYLTGLTAESVVTIETTDNYRTQYGIEAVLAGMQKTEMVFAIALSKDVKDKEGNAIPNPITNDVVVDITVPEGYENEYMIGWAPKTEIGDLTDEDIFQKDLTELFYPMYVQDVADGWARGLSWSASSYLPYIGSQEALSLKEHRSYTLMPYHFMPGTEYVIYAYAIDFNDELATASLASNVARVEAKTEDIVEVAMNFEFGVSHVKGSKYSTNFTLYSMVTPDVLDQEYTYFTVREEELAYEKDPNGKPVKEVTQEIAEYLMQQTVIRYYTPYTGVHVADESETLTIFSDEYIAAELEYGSVCTNTVYFFAAAVDKYGAVCSDVTFAKMDLSEHNKSTEIELAVKGEPVEGKEGTFNITVCPGKDNTIPYAFAGLPKAEMKAMMKMAGLSWDNYNLSGNITSYVNNIIIGQFPDPATAISSLCGYTDTLAIGEQTVTEDMFFIAFGVYESGVANNVQYFYADVYDEISYAANKAEYTIDWYGDFSIYLDGAMSTDSYGYEFYAYEYQLYLEGVSSIEDLVTGEYNLICNYASGSSEASASEGTCTVAVDGENYTLTVVMKFEDWDGNETGTHTITYTGPITEYVEEEGGWMPW